MEHIDDTGREDFLLRCAAINNENSTDKTLMRALNDPHASVRAAARMRLALIDQINKED